MRESPADATANYRRNVRHINYDARIDPNVAPAMDAQWEIAPGLANSAPGYVSFQAVNQPGHYLRHSSFDFLVGKNDGSMTFKSDATFRQVPGAGRKRSGVVSIGQFSGSVHPAF